MVLSVSRLVIVTKPVSHAHTLGIFYWQIERSDSILLIGFPAPDLVAAYWQIRVQFQDVINE